MAAHGYVRATEDIDLMVEPGSLPTIRRVVAALGYRWSGPEIQFRSGTKMARLLKTFPGTDGYLVLDLVLVNDQNRAIWESRCPVKMPVGTVNVISVEALKTMKRESNRGIDQTDIERLEKGIDESGHAS